MAGIAFFLMAGKSELNFINLAVYATAGAIFLLFSAWRLRSQRGVADPMAGDLTKGLLEKKLTVQEVCWVCVGSGHE